jgi:hypothetical protein
MRAPAGKLLAAALALLAAGALAGCGSGSSATTGDTRPLVTFGRTGGTDGRVYGLVIERGGGATLTQYPQKIRRFEVDGDKRDELRDELGGLDFGRLQPSYLPSAPTAEGYRYSVTYANTTVQASERADMPDKLRSVIELLNGLLDAEN